MSVEVLDADLGVMPDMIDDVFIEMNHEEKERDARRKLEDKIEEIRLRREVQEFDFDF